MFKKNDADLVVSISGSTDQVTVKNWFANGHSQLGTIQAGDGTRFEADGSNGLLVDNYSQGTSYELIFAPQSNVSLEYLYFSGLDGSGTLTKQTVDKTDGTSWIELVAPSGGVAEQYLYFSGLDGSGTLTKQTVDNTDGTSWIELIAPSSIVADQYLYFSGLDGSGALTKQTVDNTDGTSWIELIAPSNNVADQYLYFSGLDGSGTLTKQTVDNIDGTSWIEEVAPSVGVAEEYYYFTGLDGGGALTKQVIDSTTGSSQIVLIAPTSGVASELLSFAGLDGAGTLVSESVIVASGGTLELSGSMSVLSAVANITNNSNATAGVLVAGQHQVVGDIVGTGNLTINSGCDLTATQISGGSVVIGSGATLTLAASSNVAAGDAGSMPAGQAAIVASVSSTETAGNIVSLIRRRGLASRSGEPTVGVRSPDISVVLDSVVRQAQPPAAPISRVASVVQGTGEQALRSELPPSGSGNRFDGFVSQHALSSNWQELERADSDAIVLQSIGPVHTGVDNVDGFGNAFRDAYSAPQTGSSARGDSQLRGEGVPSAVHELALDANDGVLEDWVYEGSGNGADRVLELLLGVHGD